MESFKKCVSTYIAFNFALFGKECELYQNLVAVCQLLETRAVEQLQDYYEPTVLTQYTWVILNDAR